MTVLPAKPPRHLSFRNEMNEPLTSHTCPRPRIAPLQNIPASTAPSPGNPRLARRKRTPSLFPSTGILFQGLLHLRRHLFGHPLGPHRFVFLEEPPGGL